MSTKMDVRKYIKIRGANENNLKNIDVDIPRNELVVLTGLSGSGKSSLAFDTIYAEGQRRYMESLSSYARQFLGQMEKPDVESIEGLSPAISIDQKSTNQFLKVYRLEKEKVQMFDFSHSYFFFLVFVFCFLFTQAASRYSSTMPSISSISE